MNKAEIIQTGIKSLQVTVTALILGVVGFIVAGAVVTSSTGSEFAELEQEIIWMIAGGIALFAIFCAFIGQFLFKKKLSRSLTFLILPSLKSYSAKDGQGYMLPS